MTIPPNWPFALNTERILSENRKDMEVHWREFVVSLNRMYETVAQATNGTFRTAGLDEGRAWIPVLNGATPGTFTYSQQYGWIYRQGLLVDCWFDVAWTAVGTAAGNLYLELPYKVAITSGMPFVGVVQSSAITYTGGTGIVVNAISNTYRAEFWNVGSGFTTANQAVVGSGRLIGHVRYIGQQNE